ncbi:hypothetical protein LJC02_00945 [Breznakia sp. OttesenSCG-928-G09]|nr:hypothetical protein [Breznakia sp. OttesenSCG-928-G09]
MRKTLVELAEYLKLIIVPETDEAYAVNPIVNNISNEENIRHGISAFRIFLLRFYDEIITKGNEYDAYKKVAHEYENRTTLSGYYPFLNNLKILLMKIGFYGKLENNHQYLRCDNKIFNEKITTAKNIECLQFLSECGICIEGIDLQDKKQNLANIKTVNISYPDDSAMLVGLKAMIVAEKELGTLTNQDVFLRCDYRILKNADVDITLIVKDTIHSLPIDIQAFVLQLHHQYLDKGLKVIVEIKGYWVYIKYIYKRKDLWGINASLNNGFHINVKAKNMQKYIDTIETFPPFLKEVINKGYGCGRKNKEIGHCDGGCRGMIIPLDNTAVSMYDDIKRWFDKELEFM